MRIQDLQQLLEKFTDKLKILIEKEIGKQL